MNADIYTMQQSTLAAHDLQAFARRHPRSLLVCHLNAQSLMAKHKMREIKTLFPSALFDIILISETWLQKQHASNRVHLDGYSLLRVDRGIGGQARRGGGVAAYVHNKLQPYLLCYSTNDVKDRPEYLFFNVTVREATFLIGVVYKPPQVRYLDLI